MSREPRARVDAPTEAWDRYWSQGLLHSCTGAFQGNYDGPMRQLWERWFGALPHGATVVDIGTGNGAIAAIAAQVSRAAGLELAVHGVDLADIDPMRTVPDAATLLAGIRFHPRTSAAALPFADGEVTAVCGQYALEYTPMDEVLAELARVLAPDGQAAFILHHPASVVLETTRADLEHTALVLHRKGVIEVADRMLGRLDSARAEQDRLAFNRAAAQVSEAIAQTRFPELLRSVLGQLGQIIEGIGTRPPAELRKALARFRREMVANRDRLLNLKAVALDSGALEALSARAAGLGLQVSAPELVRHDSQRLMGWWMDLSR